eukprot:ANDGO_01926.mRNA.1 Polyamine aminopropyltransferase
MGPNIFALQTGHYAYEISMAWLARLSRRCFASSLYSSEVLACSSVFSRRNVLEVVNVEDRVYRSGDRLRVLTLGNHIIQSAMDLKDPERLVIDYIRLMSTARFFFDAVAPPSRQHRDGAYAFDSILFLGCGGASLIRYFASLMPARANFRFDVVDWSSLIFEAAVKCFRLEPAKKKVVLHQQDAMEFLASSENLRSYDLILVDLFSPTGPADVLLLDEFWNLCRESLCDNGVLASNFWYSLDESLHPEISKFRQAFPEGNYVIPTLDHANCVAFGIKTETHRTSDTILRIRQSVS